MKFKAFASSAAYLISAISAFGLVYAILYLIVP